MSTNQKTSAPTGMTPLLFGVAIFSGVALSLYFIFS